MPVRLPVGLAACGLTIKRSIRITVGLLDSSSVVPDGLCHWLKDNPSYRRRKL